MTLDLAHQRGSSSDRKAADRLQRRYLLVQGYLLLCGITYDVWHLACLMSLCCSLFACRLLHDDQKESGLLPVLARLIKQFDRRLQSKEHADDLVQCLHVVLRMLERLGKEGTLRGGTCFRIISCAPEGNIIRAYTGQNVPSCSGRLLDASTRQLLHASRARLLIT